MQDSTLQHITVQHRAGQDSTVQYNTVQCSTVQYRTVRSVLYSAVDYDTVHVQLGTWKRVSMASSPCSPLMFAAQLGCSPLASWRLSSALMTEVYEKRCQRDATVSSIDCTLSSGIACRAQSRAPHARLGVTQMHTRTSRQNQYWVYPCPTSSGSERISLSEEITIYTVS